MNSVVSVLSLQESGAPGARQVRHIGLHHLLDEPLERVPVLPAEFPHGASAVAHQSLRFLRAATQIRSDPFRSVSIARFGAEQKQSRGAEVVMVNAYVLVCGNGYCNGAVAAVVLMVE